MPSFNMKLTAGLFPAVLACSVSLSAAPGRLDTTQRATRVSTEQKAALPETKAIERNEVLMDKRFQAAPFEKKEALVGERQSSIAMEESRAKEMITPERKTYDTIDRKESPWAGKESRYSTADDAYRTRVATRFQDKIGDASPISQDVKPAVQQRTTFDRINRFAFRKNRDQGVSVTPAGSESPAGDASAHSSPGAATAP
jgi:hypothetical protein